MNEKDAGVLTDQLYKTMNILNREMKTAQDYGIGFPLYHSEVHLIDLIQKHEGANGKELAETHGVTTGAIWQTTKKLISKNLIESYQEPNNKKEVYYRLTDLGRKASEGHRRHHEALNAAFTQNAANHISDSDMKTVMRFLEMAAQYLHGG
ncbi:MarR family transcriptional regulator [Lachnospiraceae bacterium ZAX-1]